MDLMTKNLDKDGLSSIAKNYDLFYIDLWGVLHNGINLHQEAVKALNGLEQEGKELFTVVELFENVRIELKDEIFQGDYAIYTRDNNTIKLTGDVSIQSPTRLLTGHELIADIDNNKRILNSANDESLVEVLLENNADN